jgi:hypothetical protein
MNNTSHAIDRIIEGAQEYAPSRAGSSARIHDLDQDPVPGVGPALTPTAKTCYKTALSSGLITDH